MPLNLLFLYFFPLFSRIPIKFKIIFEEIKGGIEMITLKIMNQDFVKLDHFNGTNFTRWQDKMKFYLLP